MVTGQLVDTPTRGLDKSRTGQLANTSSRVVSATPGSVAIGVSNFLPPEAFCGSQCIKTDFGCMGFALNRAN